MASSLKGKTIVLGAAADTISGQWQITKIKWIGDDIADGDVLILDDAAGNVIFHVIANADDDDISEDFVDYDVNGITVDTMTSNHGTCYVYFR